MKQRVKKYSAIFLACLMALSGAAVIQASAFAKTPQSNISLTNTMSAAQQHGTGDNALSDESLSALPHIDSVSDYYQVSGTFESPDSAGLAAKVDNSQNKYFPPIGDQGSINSCGTWASVYYQMSYMQNRAQNRTATASNSRSAMWTYTFLNSGYNTGTYADQVLASEKKEGCASQLTSPDTTNLTKWNATKAAWTDAQQNRVQDYYMISPPSGDTPITGPKDADLNTIKTALQNGEILCFSTYVSFWQYNIIQANSQVPENNSHIGEIITPYATAANGGHRMTIVGYNDDIWTDINADGIVQEGEKGAFKVANSWGTAWGNNGFIWVSYDMLNPVSSVNTPDLAQARCNEGADTFFRSITKINVLPDAKISGINLEYTLNTQNRSTIRVVISAADENGTVTYNAEPFQRYTLGSFSFDGTTTPSDGTFVCDLSKVIPNLTDSSFQEYSWSVQFKDTANDSSILKVKDVKVTSTSAGKTYDSDLTETISLNNSSASVNILPSTESSFATIYYKGYSTPYIHYQVGSGAWTNVPGYAMTATSEFSGYTHKYTIDLGTEAAATLCFNDGNGNWDNNNGQNYQIIAGTYTYKNGTFTPIEPGPHISDFAITPANGVITAGDSVNMTVHVTGVDNHMTQFAYEHNGQETIIYDYAYAYAASNQFTQPGTYKLIVRVKETPYSSTIVTAEKTITVLPENSNSITLYYKGYSNPYIHYQTGTENWTEVPGYAMAPASDISGFTHKVIIDLGSTSYANICFNDGNNHWDNNNEQNYRVYSGTYTYQNGVFTPLGTPNKITIFYKGFTSPYIHYQVGTGEWTNVPGYGMTATSEMNGFTHKYTIDLNGYSYASLCFNNGNGSWDNNSGQNYRVYAGVYTYQNGSFTPVSTNNSVTVYYKGFSTPYIHYQTGSGNWTVIPGFAMANTTEISGYTHKYTINLGNADYTNVCFNDGNGNWDSNYGQNYQFQPGVYTYQNGQIIKIG